jgi:tetratricopeptide (TPR) repeat protein
MIQKYSYLIIIFLIISSYASFSRIAGNDFINLDDDTYITENSFIQESLTFTSIKWAFVNRDSTMWQPMTWISLMVDWKIFGANASGYHIINLLFHIGSVIFLFLFLLRTTNNLWSSAFAAAFFALHPRRVESVAGVAERKDVLSMFFGMATLYVYAFYVETQKLSKYLFCFCLFTLSLMSKPMMVTIPLLLLLVDYWPLQRWQKLVMIIDESKCKEIGKLISEKIPFVCLAIASSVITFFAQSKGNTITSMEHLNFYQRFSSAIVAYAVYLKKIFWPVDLAVFYPYDLSLPFWQIFFSAIIIVAITIYVLYYIKGLPFIFVGWFWYLGTLVPVIGLVQIGAQAMADRYSYLPSIGIAIMLAWGITLLFQLIIVQKKIIFFIAIIILCMLVISTWMQCGYWRNSMSLFDHSLRVTKNNYLAYNNLGVALYAEGMFKEAIDNYNQAISKNLNYANAYDNRGYAYAILYNNRGNAYVKLYQYKQALEDYGMAIRIKPDYAEAYNNYGSVYLLQGEKNLGCHYARKACAMGVCKALEKARSNGSCR